MGQKEWFKRCVPAVSVFAGIKDEAGGRTGGRRRKKNAVKLVLRIKRTEKHTHRRQNIKKKCKRKSKTNIICIRCRFSLVIVQMVQTNEKIIAWLTH